MITLLETPNYASAWCIDRQGTVYDVYVHPFGSLQDDSLEDVAWLWCNGFTDVKDKAAEYYLVTLWSDCDFSSGDMSIEEFKQEICDSVDEIECLRGNSNAPKFASYICALADDRFRDFEWNDDWIDYQYIERVGEELKAYLNNNILRVRFGSEFQTTVTREGSLYFRISSNSFDWYRLIINFIDELSQRRKIKDITVEKDKESSGSSTVYVNHMPLNDFLMNKPVVMESIRLSCE